VVIQAWAHGLPVVAAASTGPAALIRYGEDGRLVAVDDPVALAAAIRDLLDDATGRRALAAAGLARVAGEFSREAVVDRWRDLFAVHGAG
jgi:glycosyltransferase involved in cell wall biosynthesis